jgi:hypothetical protein
MRDKKYKPRIIKKDFLQSLAWKRWRYTLVDYYENKDCITNKPLRKGFNVHHLDCRSEHYTILKEERFRPLNKDTHDCVHFLYRYYKKDPFIIDRLREVLDLMVKYNED